MNEDVANTRRYVIALHIRFSKISPLVLKSFGSDKKSTRKRQPRYVHYHFRAPNRQGNTIDLKKRSNSGRTPGPFVRDHNSVIHQMY